MVVLTTGVLLRDLAATNAHVEVVNLDSTNSNTVTVEILDWGPEMVWNNPQPVAVGPTGPVTVGPHTHQSFIAVIVQSTAVRENHLSHYEIRITLSSRL